MGIIEIESFPENCVSTVVCVLFSRVFRTTSANALESDLGCTSRVYFHNVTLTSHNVTMTSKKPCQYNNKFDRRETNDYNIPQDAINEI